MADTAALVVALSAQLTKFEKDMKGAVDIAARRTKEIEGTFAKMNAEIQNQFGGLAQSGLSRLGPIGSVIGKLGPVAITTAAGIGALAIGFDFLSRQVAEFVQQAGKLRDAADTTGLTISQLKELATIGLQVGVSADTVESSIGRMTVAVDQLRDGTGPLWEQLKKINPTLLAQVGSAKSSADAINLLAKAYVGLGSEFEKNAFLRAVFGRSGLSFGRVLQQVGEAGGLTGADANFDRIVKQVDDLSDKLAEIKKRTSDLWGKAFAVDILNAQIAAALAVERIAKAVASIWEQGKNTAPPNSLLMWLLTGGGKTTIGNLPIGEPPTTRRTTPDILAPTVTRPPPAKLTLEQEIRQMEEWIAAMGDAVSQEEKLWLQELKLQKAIKERTVTEGEAARVRDAATLQQVVTNATLRERLGIASEEEIVEGKLAQIKLQQKDITLTSTEAIKAETLARKEAKEAADALAVRLSNMPGAMRAGLDATLLKQFDQAAVNMASNFENAIADVALSSKSLKDAFKDLADSIIRDLIRITLRLAVTGPLLKALGGAFSVGGVAAPGPGDVGNPFGRQHGGPVRAGQPYVVGEKGPELFVPKSSGQIVPSGVNKSSTGTGLQVIVNNTVSNETETRASQQQGPNADIVVIDIVKRGMASGKFDDVNRGRFGLRPMKAR